MPFFILNANTFHAKYILICTWLLTATLVFGQSKSDSFDPENFNKPWLEHLIKQEIDAVRKDLKIAPLICDEKLFKASQHHSEYLVKHQSLTHYQENKKNTHSPQLRARYFGAIDYAVGENIASVTSPTKINQLKNEFSLKTYDEVAKAFKKAWVSSPPHYANIANRDYDITAVTVNYNPETKSLYSVQVFADVNNTYIPKLNPSVFPYAIKELYSQATSNFEPIQEKHVNKHAYGIKANKKTKYCDDAATGIFNGHTIALNIYSDSVYLGLRKGELKKFKRYFEEKKNGVSAEFERFKYNYSCNPADNHIIPTRRNGRCEFNGYVTPPMFGKQILLAIEAREQQMAEQRKRIHRDEFIFVNLGAFPSDMGMGEHFNINLLVFTNKRLCKVIEGVSSCGNRLKPPVPHLPIAARYDTIPFAPKDTFQVIKFRVYFEQNKTDFDHEAVMSKIHELEQSKFVVKKAKLNAFASVEGTKEINEQLFRKRAKVILHSFEKQGSDTIPFNITTIENWPLFYRQIKNTEFEYLSSLDTPNARLIINEPQNVAALEKNLSKQRYVDVFIYLVPKPSQQLTIDLAQQEFNFIVSTLQDKKRFPKKQVARLLEIQSFLYSQVQKGNLAFEHLHLLHTNIPLIKYKRAVFEFQYANNTTPYALLALDLEDLATDKSLRKTNAADYLSIAILTSNRILSHKEEMAHLATVTSFAQRNSLPQQTIDSLTRCSQHENIIGYYENTGKTPYGTIKAQKSELYTFYNSQLHEFSPSEKYLLARFYIYANEDKWALDILQELVDNGAFNVEYFIQYVKTFYAYHSIHQKGDFVQLILDSYDKLTPEQWCGMFIGPCNISLPIFDNRSIRNLYCSTCVSQ